MFNKKIYFKSLALLLGQTSYTVLAFFFDSGQIYEHACWLKFCFLVYD